MTQKDTQKCRYCKLPIHKVEVSKKWMWYHTGHGWTFCRNEDSENNAHSFDYKSNFTSQRATPYTFKDYLTRVEEL